MDKKEEQECRCVWEYSVKEIISPLQCPIHPHTYRCTAINSVALVKFTRIINSAKHDSSLSLFLSPHRMIVAGTWMETLIASFSFGICVKPQPMTCLINKYRSFLNSKMRLPRFVTFPQTVSKITDPRGKCGVLADGCSIRDSSVHVLEIAADSCILCGPSTRSTYELFVDEVRILLAT
jgi:hypothetical protein